MADFEVGDSGASTSYPMQCSALRKGSYVIIKQRPCKIVDMSTSKTGKHGHAKVNIVAIDIFTSKKYEDICPSTHKINVPHVKRTEYTLVNIDDDGFTSLMCEDASTRSDLKLPDNNLGIQIKDKFLEDKELLVTVVKACEFEEILAFKVQLE